MTDHRPSFLRGEGRSLHIEHANHRPHESPKGKDAYLKARFQHPRFSPAPKRN